MWCDVIIVSLMQAIDGCVCTLISCTVGVVTRSLELCINGCVGGLGLKDSLVDLLNRLHETGSKDHARCVRPELVDLDLIVQYPPRSM